MNRLSISLKLAVWYAGIMLLGFAFFGLMMRFVLAKSMLSWKDRTLLMRAGRVESVLSSYEGVNGDHASAESVDTRLDALVGMLPEGEWIQIARGDGTRLFPRGANPRGMPALSFLPCSVQSFRDLHAGREHFRQLCQPVTFHGDNAFLLVPSPLAEDRILLRTFTVGLYQLVPFVLAISVLGGYLIGRRGLQPVDRLIAEARSVTARDLTKRLTVPAADDQMRTLAITWNDLLGRIETALIRVTQFTADASHELRSPIAYIRAAAQYSIGNESTDEASKEMFRAIADEAALTGELLDNLLMLAHPSTALPSLAQIEPVKVADVVSDTVQQFFGAARRKRQTLQIDALDPEVMLSIDPLHLRRVLTTILDNALKYTPEEGRVSVRCEHLDGVRLQIKDSGVGIAEHHLPRVFDRFFRVDGVRSEMSQGVGLGLAIAKKLSGLYGGKIGITSKLGHGTIVTIAFPASPSCTGTPLSFRQRV